MADSPSSADIEHVVRLIESLDNSAFDYLELQVGELKVTIGKGEPPAPAASGPAPAASSVAPQVLAPQPPAATPAPVAAAEPATSAGTVEIVAPTMGIFYAQAEPGKPPFVTVGALVEESTTVALVEVMKTFHAVAAGVRGTVVEVCVQDAQLVEFGEVLYRVEPAAR